MPLSLTWAEVWARRLARHALLERAPATRLVDVAGEVCGIHAQVMPAAELSLGVRVGGVTRRDVQAALWEERRLVKTYGIRGTLHLFPARELPLWMAALRRRAEFEDPKRLAQVGLDRAQLAALVDAIGRALDGQRLTTRQLGDAVAARVGAWAQEETAPAWGGAWPRWRRAVGWAAVAGVLCFGPNAGSEVTFVRPDQWLGTWRDVDPHEALPEVFRRYLRAYGPATHRDFAQWFSMPPRAARELATALAGELAEADVEGYRALLLAADAAAAFPPARASVRLLPHFDCYLRGCHPREQLVGDWAVRSAGGTGNVPVLLVGGIVGGVWERRARGRQVELRVEPFQPLGARQRRALAAEAARIGEVLEAPVSLTTGPVALRPHL